MSTLFGNLTTDGLEESTDRMGGRDVHEAGTYLMTVKTMYAGQSAKGARCVTVVGTLDNSKEYRETIYITNVKGENWFLNKQDTSKKVPLPGFTTIDEMCLILSGKPLSEQDSEEKVVNLWNSAEGKELPTAVPMLIDCLGKDVRIAVTNKLKNKSKSDGNGGYVPQAETTNENNINKVFHPTLLLTVPEAKRDAQLTAEGKETIGAEFHDKWVERNKGVVIDARDLKDGEAGKSGRPGKSTPPVAGEKKAAVSIFG